MMDKRCYERSIFISSTIQNLKQQRKMLNQLFQNSFNCVRFRPIMSDYPFTIGDSGNDYVKYGNRNPNLFILNKVKETDYFLLLLDDSAYGERNILDKDNQDVISITHAEFRTAFKRTLPIFVFIPRLTYIRYWVNNLISINGILCWHEDEAWNVYQLIREIKRVKYHSNITVSIYKDSIEELQKNVCRIFNSYDRSKFMESSYIKEIYNFGEKFQVKWRIENDGCIIWKNRFFIEVRPKFSYFLHETFKSMIKKQRKLDIWQLFQQICAYFIGKRQISTAEKRKYSIPVTYPGESVELKVNYIAPDFNGKFFSVWKIVDEKDKYIYRKSRPLTLEYECRQDD